MVFDGMTSFQMYINPIFLANVFVAFTESLMVWDYNVRLRTSDVARSSLVVVAFTLLLMYGLAFQLDSVNGPVRIFASSEGLIHVYLFLLQLPRC